MGEDSLCQIVDFLYPDFTDGAEEIEGFRNGKVGRSLHLPHPRATVPERVQVVRVGEGSPKPWASTRQVGSTHASAKGLETALMPLL